MIVIPVPQSGAKTVAILPANVESRGRGRVEVRRRETDRTAADGADDRTQQAGVESVAVFEIRLGNNQLDVAQ